jgi:hypothetical protein
MARVLTSRAAAVTGSWHMPQRTRTEHPPVNAADLVRRMAGRYRLPDALRRADALARAGPPAAAMTLRRPAPGLWDDGDEKAGLVLGAPVQGAPAFGAFLVGGRELPGERVAWP